MNNAPTIVRLIRFPASYRLSRKGKQFIGPLKRSGPVILSERHDPIDVTLRISVPGITFATGGTTVTHTEAFSEGEQRDVLLPWQLVVGADARIPQLVLEIDVSYSGTSEIHTATVPLDLTYGVSRVRAAAVVGGAVAAVALATGVARRNRNVEIVVEDDEAELTVDNTGRPTGGPSSSKKGSSKKKAASSSKKASAKKAGSSKAASSSKKGSSSKKASSTKKATSSKKAAASSKKGASSKKAAPSKKASVSSSRKGSASSKKGSSSKKSTSSNKSSSKNRPGGRRR